MYKKYKMIINRISFEYFFGYKIDIRLYNNL